MSSSTLGPHIHFFPSQSSTSTTRASPTYIIYFITGNPGLIEYYRTFLTHLYGLLLSPQSWSSQTPPTIHVFGRSLSGFETQAEQSGSNKDKDAPPYGLREQIARSEEALEALVDRVKKGEPEQDIRVVLMGHSVGTYISLEIIRRQREKKGGLRIVGGVLLTPTITDLAKSPNGRKTSWLITLPYAPYLINLLATPLTALPQALLIRLISTLLSFPHAPASTTAAFLKSPHGVHSSLHMARDEMLQMTTDKWTDEIWGAAHATTHEYPRPILRFLYAKEDHWIADETREEVVRTRGVLVGEREGDREADGLLQGGQEEDWKPRMEIDEAEGWPHGFCIRHSVPVAERVVEYVRDILETDKSRD